MSQLHLGGGTPTFLSDAELEQLMRMLRAAGQVAAIEPLRAAYSAVIADPADAAADNARFVWHRLLDGRAIDAERLAAALRPLADDDAQVEAFVAALGIAPAAPVRGVLQAWLRWVDALALDAHCRDSDLVNFKRPRDYVFVREIPKSPVGKVLRRKLVAGEYEADGDTSSETPS